MIINNRFDWNEHINHGNDKLRAIMTKFTIVKNTIPYSSLLEVYLYNALGKATIYYGLCRYGRTCKSHLDQINWLQLGILKTFTPIKLKTKYEELSTITVKLYPV